MLNAIIRFSLRQRFLIVALSVFLLAYGSWQIVQLPIDVFPDLNRPRVVVMTEAPGMAPEEVETLITFPLETTLNGASGVQAVRSSSGVGISVVYVEFDWGTDIYNDRQIVNERLALVSDRLPVGVKPQLAPISSIMGQIMLVGMYSQQTEKTLLFKMNAAPQPELNQSRFPDSLRQQFAAHKIRLSETTDVHVDQPDTRWFVDDRQRGQWYAVVQVPDGLEVHRATSPMELRTLADWSVRQRLLTIPGVSQVFVMGGQRRQFQVLVDPDLLLNYGVTLHEVKEALRKSNQNSTGGYLDEQGPNELLVRVLGRVKTIEDLKGVVVKHRDGRSILLRQVATVQEGPQVKRGDSSASVKDENGTFVGGSAVVLTINKQPNADTREVTIEITKALAEIGPRLPNDVRIQPKLYQQKTFIDLSIDNVKEALQDGGILVVIVLFAFLLNFRTTFITLTAIPLSIVVTGLVFTACGLSINTMTLGGLAVAIGELVDDAIVDVENIFRRLRENKQSTNPKPPLLVVFQASVEVRNSIVFGSMIVVLVFIPLFALTGMEGRLFTPLGIAYIVSILSSLLVSLTVTPVLCYWLLPKARFMARETEGPVLRLLKWLASWTIRFSLKVPLPMLLLSLIAVIVSGLALSKKERDFLPPFNEGAIQVNVLLPPGTSLAKSNEIATRVERRLQEIKDVEAVVRKTGRAELDEHAEGVNTTEFILTIDQHSDRSREELLDVCREAAADIPGIVVSVEQPLAHLISHMISGVKAEVAIKLYGNNLDMLRRKADEMKMAIQGVAGVTDLQVEQQVIIPQLRIEIDGNQLEQFGLTRDNINEFVETAMNGVVVSQVLEGQRTFDLLVRMQESYREDLEAVKRLSINLPGGGTTTLGSVTNIYRAGGPNTIKTEKVQRRIVVQCNTSGRGLVDVVQDIKREIDPIADALPAGYFVEYGGQFESQQSASRVIAVLFLVSLCGMFLLLFSMFRSVNLALQVMIALPMAFIGSVAALYFTGQTLTVASMVGFISLCGIASRNGILLINHYLHLVQFEGETWSKEMIVRAGKERLAPVLMTALTSGIALVPLAMAAGEPGKEILYPVATVIIGGLISSTILEFLVRPALFWKFGRRALDRRISNRELDLAALSAPAPTNGP
ncbi:MAG: efflux RND transporter permease subunit [Pirellulaceae bacterium]